MRWWMGGLCLSLIACTDEQPKPIALEGWVSGCVELRPGPACSYVGGSTLSVWLPRPGPWTVELDEVRARVRAVAALEGQRLEIPVHAQHRLLTRNGREVFELELRPVASKEPEDEPRKQTFERYQEARAALRAGDIPSARALLEEVLSAARAGSDARRFREASLLLAYVEGVLENHLPEASTLLAAIPAPLPEDAEARLLIELSKGQLDARVSAWSEALAHLDTAARIAEATGSPYQPLVESERASVAILLGNLDGALEQLDARLARADLSPCTRATLAGNAGWARVLLDAPGAEARLEEALSLFSEHCPRAASEDDVRLSLAWRRLETATDGPERALALLEGLKAPDLVRARTWTTAVRARAAEKQRRWKRALHHFAELESLGQRLRFADLGWLGMLGQARVHRALGQARSSLEALQRAEAYLDERRTRLPLVRGHFDYLSQREESGWMRVEALAEAGRIPEALEAHDQMRARSRDRLRLRARVEGMAPEQRSAWLRAVGAYERARARLDAHVEASWASPVSAAAQRRVEEARLQTELDAALDAVAALVEVESSNPTGPAPAIPEGTHLVLPVEGRAIIVATSEQAKLHPWVPVPAWPKLIGAKGGEIIRLVSESPAMAEALLAHTELASPVLLASFALGPAPSPLPAAGKMLVVADPRRDLSDARSEAKEVEAALAQRGWGSEVLIGEAATRAAVLERLGRVDALHYAGHGHWAGRHGWNSSLSLADAPTRVGDLLLRPAPPTVVLSGCTTAGASEEDAQPALGMAQAFVAAGARAVLATHRTVDSKAARAFAQALYDPERPERSLALRHLEALRRMKSQDLDWGAFLLLVP